MEPRELHGSLLFMTERSQVADEQVLEHFAQNPSLELDDGRPFYLFTHERAFLDRNHAIDVHGRNNPAIPFHLYHYALLMYCYAGTLVVETADGEH